MLRFVATTLVLSAALAAPAAAQYSQRMGAAQTTQDTYAIRRELGNDSYVWEPMLKRGLPTHNASQGLVNPAARTQRAFGVQLISSQQPAAGGYYGQQTAYQPAQQSAPATAPRRFISTAEIAKQSQATSVERPFNSIARRPTVSPYLGLFREEFESESPNYHTFVRPRLEEQQARRQQQLQQDRLRRQKPRPAPNAPRISSAAAAGNASRYGDTGQFYNSWVR